MLPTTYATLQRKVLPMLVRLLGDRDAAEDVFHEGLLRSLALVDGERAAGSPEAWLFTVCRRCGLDALRRVRREQQAIAALTIAAEVLDEDADGVDDCGRGVSIAEEIRRCQSLTLRQRLIAETAWLQRAPHAQIALSLGITRGTVKSTLAEVKRRLRQSNYSRRTELALSKQL